MTKDEILKLKAGRGLDALVAEKVMGWTGEERFFGSANIPPAYSTDIAAAWEVVEKLSSNKEWDEHPFELIRNYAFKDMWEANFNDYKYDAVASTAPLAICRAALLAVMEA